MSPGEGEKRRLVKWIQSELDRTTGRWHRIHFDALDLDSLRELQQVLRDLDAEKTAAVNRARLTPWLR